MVENVHVYNLRMGTHPHRILRGPQCDIHERRPWGMVRCGGDAWYLVTFEGLSGHVTQHVCERHRPKDYPVED